MRILEKVIHSSQLDHTGDGNNEVSVQYNTQGFYNQPY